MVAQTCNSSVLWSQRQEDDEFEASLGVLRETTGSEKEAKVEVDIHRFHRHSIYKGL